jgi:Family of unknown function (DUF6252)
LGSRQSEEIMTRRQSLLLGRLLVLLTGGFSACGSPTENTRGVDTTAAASTISATIDGVPWSAIASTARLSGSGNFDVFVNPEPNSNSISFTLQLFSVTTPGTYPLGVSRSMIGGTADVIREGRAWSTTQESPGGSVTLTEVSTTRIAGTFSFQADPMLGVTGSTLTFRDGRFSANVTGSGTLQLPDNIGSTVEGTIASSPFAARQVSVSRGTGLGFGFGGRGMLGIVQLSEFTGVGTYALRSGTERYMRVGIGTDTWGSDSAQSSGIITITSATATRIKGTIAATLLKLNGPLAQPTAMVNLNFNLGVP